MNGAKRVDERALASADLVDASQLGQARALRHATGIGVSRGRPSLRHIVRRAARLHGRSLSRGSVAAVAGMAGSAVVFGVLTSIHLTALGGRSAIETVIATSALLSAGLLLGHFRHSRQRNDLLLLIALTAVALTDFVFSALPAFTGSGLPGVGSGPQIGCGGLVAVGFAAAAFVPNGTVAGIGCRPLRLAALATAALVTLIGIVVVQPAGASALPGTGIAVAARSPVLLAEVIVSSAILLVSGIALFCRPERDSHVLAGASFLLGAASLQYLALPVIAPDWVTARDGLRLGAYALLLAAALGRHADARRQAAAAALACERQRIARDLHDGLAQDLALIAIQGQQLASELGSEHPLTVTARRALASSRGVIVDLSASTASSTRAALCQVADELAARFSAEVDVRIETDPEPTGRDELPGRREEVVRIAREAIVNAFRHGGARHVDVVWNCTGPESLLLVSDDGCGIPEGALQMRSGYGLLTMRARATSLGGRLVIRRRARRGTEVELAFPSGAGRKTAAFRRAPARRPVLGRRKQAHGHRASTRLTESAEVEPSIDHCAMRDAKRVRGEKRPAGCSDCE